MNVEKLIFKLRKDYEKISGKWFKNNHDIFIMNFFEGLYEKTYLDTDKLCKEIELLYNDIWNTIEEFEEELEKNNCDKNEIENILKIYQEIFNYISRYYFTIHPLPTEPEYSRILFSQ